MTPDERMAKVRRFFREDTGRVLAPSVDVDRFVGILAKELDEAMVARFAEWRKEQDAKVAATQEDKEPFFGFRAYYGEFDCGYAFLITPTSVGTLVTVTNNVTKEEFELDDVASEF